MLKVFIGWDPREAAAYHTLAHSIIKRASAPVAIIPLVQSQLRAQGIYTREVDTKAATEFSLTRFLVPYLSGYEGFSLFMDCDMLVRCDIYELYAWLALSPDRAVHVCQHDYVPKSALKMDGQIQTAYPRKNWSSLMLFNNAKCRALDVASVNCLSPAGLHRFQWTTDDQIGSLPLEYNYLVGEDGQSKKPAKIVHFTEGMPFLPGYGNVEYASDWFTERADMDARDCGNQRMAA